MKNINKTLAALAAVTILSAPSIANAQTPPAQPPTQPTEQQQQAAVEAPRTASVSGSLVNVDNEKMTLTIKDSLGIEHTFQYNPQTEVIGATAGVAGLATMEGTDVMVHFKSDKSYKSDSSDRAMSDSPAKNVEKKLRIATKIEVVTQK